MIITFIRFILRWVRVNRPLCRTSSCRRDGPLFPERRLCCRLNGPKIWRVISVRLVECPFGIFLVKFRALNRWLWTCWWLIRGTDFGQGLRGIISSRLLRRVILFFGGFCLCSTILLSLRIILWVRSLMNTQLCWWTGSGIICQRYGRGIYLTTERL